MVARTLQIVNANCRNVYGRSGSFCLPRVDCRPDPDGIFGDDWNCAKCQADPKAFMPFIQGDVIDFQTNFADYHHADETTPTDPFAPTVAVSAATSYRAIIHYAATQEDTLADFASASIVAWNGERSYQIVRVDTSNTLFDSIDCWQIEIQALDPTGAIVVDSVRSQLFQKDDSCTDLTVQVVSSYSRYDCFRNYYGDPVAYAGDLFTFSNRLRFWGIVVATGIASSASFEFSGSTDEASRRLFRYNTTRWYPPYQRNLLQALIDPPSFRIGGEQYRRPAYSAEGGLFKISLEEVCTNSNIC